MTTSFEDSVRGAIFAKRAVLITGPRGYAEKVRQIAKEEGYNAVNVSLLYATTSETRKRLDQTFSRPTILVIDLNRATNVIYMMVLDYVLSANVPVILTKTSCDDIPAMVRERVESHVSV